MSDSLCDHCYEKLFKERLEILGNLTYEYFRYIVIFKPVSQPHKHKKGIKTCLLFSINPIEELM